MYSLLIPLPLPSGIGVPELPLVFEGGRILVAAFLALFGLIAATLVAMGVAGQLRALAAPRLVICPRAGSSAFIRIDLLRSLMLLPKGSRRLKVRHCTIWPRFSDCGQECVGQRTTA